MRALVTGSAGFIGRHIRVALIRSGYDVQGLDIIPAPGTWQRDARDYFRRSGAHYDVVVHAAAVVGGRAQIDGNPLALAANLELDAAMFQWAARTRPGRVVYLSSSAAYPTDLQHIGYCHRLIETDISHAFPQLPDALYGWSKLTGERLALLARAESVPVTIVRPFSGYGEDQSTDYPFPAFAARARARADPFVIWGDGQQARDWIHVDDICAAIMAMIAGGFDGPVNLGSGQATAMRELAGLMCAEAGYEPVIEVLADKPLGVAYRVADVTLMEQFFRPKVSLEEGVRRALA
jgi:nucleoside-diphosphate-sugar epimerase